MTEPIIQYDLLSNVITDFYTRYAYYVITDRAIPHASDGLKAVQKRIIYAMYQLNVVNFVKSVSVVGEVLAKYHPHGDSSVYGALVRMALDWVMRQKPIVGQGNFGSPDGDSPAAMRYTEIKMSKYCEIFLKDLYHMESLMRPNFDGSTKEPIILPAIAPNLLINGTEGIAVGLVSKIPPHNMTELLQALIFRIENPNSSLDEILNFIKGPDFPTGGTVIAQDLKEIYEKGEGSFYIKSDYTIIGKKIIFHSVPYQVKKADLLEKIAELIEGDKITGIKSVVDESHRGVIKLVIDVENNINPEVVVNHLFKYTNLYISYHFCFCALDDNNLPRIFSLLKYLDHFINFRERIIISRAQYSLMRLKKRIHLLNGYLIAIDNMETIINIIRNSNSVDSAKPQLQNLFFESAEGLAKRFSSEQIDAILDLKLSSLVKLERNKIQTELKQLQEKTEEETKLLMEKDHRNELIIKEFNELMKKYPMDRLTKIEKGETEFSLASLTPNEGIIVILDENHYMKRSNFIASMVSQIRGGKGRMVSQHGVSHSVIGQTHDKFLFFSNKAKAYSLYGYQIPEAETNSSGRAIVNLFSLEEGEKINFFINVPQSYLENIENKYIVFVTKNGYIRKNPLASFMKLKISGKLYIKPDHMEEILTAFVYEEPTQSEENNKTQRNSCYILLATKLGRAVVINLSNFRKVASCIAFGVKACILKKNDVVVSAIKVNNSEDLILSVSDKGYGKISKFSEYRPIIRAGYGVINMKCNEKNGFVVDVLQVNYSNKVLISTNGGRTICIEVNNLKTRKRNTSGVRFIDIGDDDKVQSAAIIDE